MIEALIDVARLWGSITVSVAGIALCGHAIWWMLLNRGAVWSREVWIQAGAGIALLHGGTEIMLRVAA